VEESTMKKAILAAVAIGVGGGTAARADEWGDPVGPALERFLQANRQAGFDPANWISKRSDDVAVCAGLARVDVVLELTNRSERGLEWRRTLVMDPAADLVGARYTRPDGKTTVALSLDAGEAERLYRRATDPNYGKDPLRIDRPARDRLEVRIFPVPAGATVRLALAFAAPLQGRGSRAAYHDPLDAHPDLEPAAAQASLPRASGDAVPVSLSVPIARYVPASVRLRLTDALPGAPPAGWDVTPSPGGVLLLSPVPGQDPASAVEVRSLRAAGDVTVFPAGGLPSATNAFVWRLDPAAAAAELGLEALAGVTLRLSSVEGVTSRIAPESVPAAAEPTIVMGRAWSASKVEVRVDAVGADGKTLVTRTVALPAVPGRSDEPVADAIRAYHRARLAERVFRWAGSDAKRLQQAKDYAVDLGVVGPYVSALAVPKDERGFMSRREVAHYLTDGMPFDGDSTQGDFKPAPPGSVK
jgi:hypothetical protein